jgi:hypothetical protein
MATWMRNLALHYEKTRQKYPQDKLMLIFDIDGAILDMRYLILNVLRAFDRVRGTQYFEGLEVSAIKTHENRVEQLLALLKIAPEEQKPILDWYVEQRWSPQAIREAHHPFRGVLEVIRWFQIQPNTYIGLNTGRPEKIREETLRSINHLGEAYRVKFSGDLLYMNTGNWAGAVRDTKVAGVQHFMDAGYRVFAMIDNEPDNLRAIAEMMSEEEILFLHADTLFESKRTRLPRNTARGNDYDLTDLIPEKALPPNIQLVWHGINDRANLRQFLASDFQWGECDVHLDQDTGELVLFHDPLTERLPDDEDEDLSLTLDELLKRLCAMGKSVKLDLKEGGELVRKVVAMLKTYTFDDSQLWFNGYVDLLREDGFRALADTHPNAIVQCPIDFLEPLICSAPVKTKEIIDLFTSWGINRYSINWRLHGLRTFFDQMDAWGFGVNIYGVFDLETFLQAVILMPQSITSDFNFPKWHYYGRGAGQKGTHYEYSMHKKNRKRR